MTNELYRYACPKLSAKQASSSSMFTLVFLVTLFSSLLILADVVTGIIITSLYFGLSLLTFVNKDLKLRYMELVVLCVLDVCILCIYMFSKVFPAHQVFLWSAILGIVFSVIYEITFCIKIKNGRYSNPSNNKGVTTAVSSSTIFLFVLIFKLLNNNSGTKDLAVIVLMLLCGAIILVTVISIQKLIVYLVVRGQIQEDFIDKSDVT